MEYNYSVGGIKQNFHIHQYYEFLIKKMGK